MNVKRLARAMNVLDRYLVLTTTRFQFFVVVCFRPDPFILELEKTNRKCERNHLIMMRGLGLAIIIELLTVNGWMETKLSDLKNNAER